MLYRKKPVIVDAVQFFPIPREPYYDDNGVAHLHAECVMEGVIKIPAMTVDARERRGITYDMAARYVINTLEGQMQVNPGDWIITGVRGERYPCKPDIFELTYEKVMGPEMRKAIFGGILKRLRGK